MILSKKDLKYYLLCDKISLRIPIKRKFPRPFVDVIWKYEIILRKYEYYLNKKAKIYYPLMIYYKIMFLNMSNKLTIKLEPNVFGPGLSIAHYGTIVVNPQAVVGNNCRIHEGVTIGATNGSSKSPRIGNNCFIGSGAKIIGDIEIGDNVAIGAGAVVIDSFGESNVTLAGVPARIVSHNGSKKNIVNATDIADKRKK